MARTPPERLTEERLTEALGDLPDWTVKDGKLHREYSFPDFVTAFGWMSASALLAEKLNHHPEWANVWSKVTVDLRTHESGGLTERDLTLARRMEELARRFAG